MLDLEQAQETNGLTPAMVSEDFAYMLKDCPGCYFWLGQNDREHQNSLHQPHYDFNDDTIEPALSLLAKIASTALLPASS
jgi:hippurate hydrolase